MPGAEKRPDASMPEEMTVAIRASLPGRAASLSIHCRPTTADDAERLRELAGITAQDVVFDIGCGEAHALCALASSCGARCIGVELDLDMVGT